ncbi:MAG: DUF1549 domain-containing protein [Pirellulales bacterium]
MYCLLECPQIAVACFATFLLTIPVAQAKPSSARVARQVDNVLAVALFDESTSLAPRCDDATYIRRVWLDTVGDIPPPETVLEFVIDPSAKKRKRDVRKLLQNPHYGKNWARYWRDVIFYRRIEDRALLASPAMVADLTQRFNNNVGWDKIATEFMTATGDVRNNGGTAILMAQAAMTEQTTAEVARIFLGLQIGCAQCHDHPYDRWKREQFHELAAFFPRVGVRPVRTDTKRSFEIYANNSPKNRRAKAKGRPQREHFMPDLENPKAPGTRMQPKFFLTGASLPLGTSDAERRQQLARWFTENRWFATAMVNRMWSELVGEGFYESVEDIGPERQAKAPTAIRLLSNQFRASGYDLKWLIETICQTNAYQRESRPRRDPKDIPFTANVPQRLRADQLFTALVSVLEIDEKNLPPRRRKPSQAGLVDTRKSARPAFNRLFGYDPSVAREDVAISIPQTLALMNGLQVNRVIRGTGKNTMLGRLLADVAGEEALIEELYLRCLSREPTSSERSLAFAYRNEIVRDTNYARRMAYEDLLWALINSTEFQYRK